MHFIKLKEFSSKKLGYFKVATFILAGYKDAYENTKLNIGVK